MLYGKKNCIKNWWRINIQGSANKMVLFFHLNSTENELKWNLSVKKCMDLMGIGGGTNDSLLPITAIKRMSDIFQQESFAEINKEGNKLRTYAKIKLEKGYENYLSIMANVEKRTAVTKIHLSNHDLMIEKGRHQRLHLSQRNCPFCFGNLLENESHLLLRCSTFSLLRKELFVVTKQFIPRFEFLSKDEQLKTLLTRWKDCNFNRDFPPQSTCSSQIFT